MKHQDIFGEDFDEINAITGFAAGDEFRDEAEVRDYFRRESLASMWDPRSDAADALPSQERLDEMADAVIRNRWHMIDDDD